MPINISFTNVKDVMNGLKKKEAELAKAVDTTMKEFKTRGAGWMNTSISHHYNITKAEVSKSQRGVKLNGKIKVAGVSLPNYEIKYRGRLLSPASFKLKPKMQGKKVNVNIKNGKKHLPFGAFVADNGHGVLIPFMRVSKDRYPIDAVKTVSIPQMVDEENVSKEFFEKVNDQLGKRLEHNIQRLNKK